MTMESEWRKRHRSRGGNFYLCRLILSVESDLRRLETLCRTIGHEQSVNFLPLFILQRTALSAQPAPIIVTHSRNWRIVRCYLDCQVTLTTPLLQIAAGFVSSTTHLNPRQNQQLTRSSAFREDSP